MKILKKVFLFTVVTLLLGNLSVTKVFATGDTIPNDSASSITNTKNAIDDWMPDKNLQSAIANALNKKISEISQEDLRSLDNLVANGLGINSLKGLEYATNLTSLDISNNHIVDFSNLKNIRPLRRMIADNQSFVLSPVEIDGESYTQLKANLPSFIGPFGDWDSITGNYPYPQNGEKVVEDQNSFIWSNLNQKGTFVLMYSISYAFPKQFTISWKITQEYKRNVMAQPITVRYIDAEGRKISDNVMKTGNVGEDYTTEQKVIPGYTLKEVQGNATGKFTEQAQTVTYVYTKNLIVGGDVTVNYVDTDGRKISDNVMKTGNVGEDYTTEQKVIPGYTFKEVQGNATGKFTEQAQTVTYVYTKNPVVKGDITVNYVDTDGRKISDNVMKTGNVGEDYTTEQKVIPGYTFKEVQGNATGKFTEQAQTVTYVYTKKIKPFQIDRIHSKLDGHNNLNQSVHKTFPKTGENNFLSFINITLGFLIVIGCILLAIKRYLLVRAKN